jgi:hypothetical protein
VNVTRRTVDSMLDHIGRLTEALQVLHMEADSDLPFDLWVEAQRLRHSGLLARMLQEPELPDRVCPEEGCTGGYYKDGFSYRGGLDDEGHKVWMQKWRCDYGHWHTLEARD